MDGSSYGQAFGGMARLAMVGLVALALLVPATVIAAIFGIVWLCRHVAIH
jgi:hypothetical protein